jgi:hypothetical protein
MRSIFINELEYCFFDDIKSHYPNYCKNIKDPLELINKYNITDYIYCRDVSNELIIIKNKQKKTDFILFKKKFICLLNDEDYILEAPEIIDIQTNNKYNLEIRGEKNLEKIYFNLDSLQKSFKLNIYDKNNYTQYKIKIIKKDIKVRIKQQIIYLLNLNEVIEILINNLIEISDFLNWIFDFVKNKNKSELGINSKISKDFLSLTDNLSCIYIYTLGLVKNLKDSMNISNNYNDTDIIIKYGFTKDLTRRNNEHTLHYNKIKGVELHLKYFTYINTNNLSEAEKKIKDFIFGMKLDFQFENDIELAILNKDNLNVLKKEYELINKWYSNYDIDNQIKLKELEYQIQIKDLENKILKKDLEIINYNK